MHKSVIDPGKAREAKPQDSADLVGKGYGRFVDNTWLTGGFG